MQDLFYPRDNAWRQSLASRRIPLSLYLPINWKTSRWPWKTLLIPSSQGSRVLGNSFRNAEHAPTLQQSDTRSRVELRVWLRSNVYRGKKVISNGVIQCKSAFARATLYVFVENAWHEFEETLSLLNMVVVNGQRNENLVSKYSYSEWIVRI